MRLLRGACVLALVLGACSSEPNPVPSNEAFEDVVLQGRVIYADGSPVTNAKVNVDAVSSSGIFNSNKSSQTFEGEIDADGRYRFTFPHAHRRGQQTDDDYYFEVTTPSRRDPHQDLFASYELELLDAVHNAPDVVMWDPTTAALAQNQNYVFGFDPKPAPPTAKYGYGPIDARNVEDDVFDVTPWAYADIRSNGTIYHQRLRGPQAAFRGSLVPLSRDAKCEASRRRSLKKPSCAELTDGDLRTGSRPLVEGQTADDVTVDLGEIRTVGAVRTPGCDCHPSVSTDGATWDRLEDSETGVPVRYIRVSIGITDGIKEISAWAPASELGAPTITAFPKNYERPKANSSGRSWLPGWAIWIPLALFFAAIAWFFAWLKR